MWVALLVSESRILAGETSRENLVQGQTHSSLAHLKAVADITNGSSIMASLDEASDSLLVQDHTAMPVKQ